MARRMQQCRHGSLLGLCVLAIGVAAASGGCARLRAATQPEMPVLDTPGPPPRVIAPVQAETITPPETATTTTTATDIQTPAEERPPERPAPARTEPAKPIPPPRSEPETARPEEARPNRSLQTPDSESISERAIRNQLARASADLQRVDYRTLSPNLKEQYDVAKRFIQQSEEALKAGNLVYASTLAGKAAEIAEVLPR